MTIDIKRPTAWCKKVSVQFKIRILEIALMLVTNPDWLMACIAFESAETFSPSIKNAAGSGAVGLIQFMSKTAIALKTTVEALGAMTAEKQLDYVKKYFEPHKGRLNTLEDVYMAILWPSAIGKPIDHVLFRRDDPAAPKRYIQNKGLDWNKDGVITKAEAAEQVKMKLDKGLMDRYIG
ncbi:transglycosylase SLT domain-containing protein [Desulforegula conservatrix]|uniref:transglycosylase SLT domain-containing protein n=1 Tax=Desulforegula conservatrix TaxID=153026 RepID=UPI0003F5B6C8|nr:transglycosylase SLT domain-containing protein [Desulforegula conservatrix]